MRRLEVEVLKNADAAWSFMEKILPSIRSRLQRPFADGTRGIANQAVRNAARLMEICC